MLCPYCRIEYTAEQPCFCQAPATIQKADPDSLESRGPKGYVRAVFDLREGKRFNFRMEVIQGGKPSEILVPRENRSARATLRMYRGLCSTCNNYPTCTYPRNPWRPVAECEDFDGELTTAQRWSR